MTYKTNSGMIDKTLLSETIVKTNQADFNIGWKTQNISIYFFYHKPYIIDKILTSILGYQKMEVEEKVIPFIY